MLAFRTSEGRERTRNELTSQPLQHIRPLPRRKRLSLLLHRNHQDPALVPPSSSPHRLSRKVSLDLEHRRVVDLRLDLREDREGLTDVRDVEEGDQSRRRWGSRDSRLGGEGVELSRNDRSTSSCDSSERHFRRTTRSHSCWRRLSWDGRVGSGDCFWGGGGVTKETRDPVLGFGSSGFGVVRRGRMGGGVGVVRAGRSFDAEDDPEVSPRSRSEGSNVEPSCNSIVVLGEWRKRDSDGSDAEEGRKRKVSSSSSSRTNEGS